MGRKPITAHSVLLIIIKLLLHLYYDNEPIAYNKSRKPIRALAYTRAN